MGFGIFFSNPFFPLPFNSDYWFFYLLLKELLVSVVVDVFYLLLFEDCLFDRLIFEFYNIQMYRIQIL